MLRTAIVGPLILLMELLLLSPGAAAKLGLRFHSGETLTYHMVLDAAGKGRDGSAYSARVEGDATLKVRKVRADGVAEVEVVARGKGKMSLGHETVPYGNEPATPLLATVRPDGTISELRNRAGQKTYLLTEKGISPVSSAGILMRYLLSDYALAGIQLPGALPSPGGSWTGVHRKELGHGRRDAEMTVSLQAKTTTFKYTSTSAYKGRRCAIIKCQAALTGSFRSGKNDIPGTYYFDVAEGRLVGVEVHAQDLGGEQGKTDYSAVLANVTAAP